MSLRIGHAQAANAITATHAPIFSSVFTARHQS
jgi:hypothetical protein